MELNITAKPNPERYVVAVTGEVDISNADELRKSIDLALEQPTEEVCLDFDEVVYIKLPTGIGVLVGAAHHAEEHGKRFAIVNAQPGVCAWRSCSGSTGRFPLRPSVSNAPALPRPRRGRYTVDRLIIRRDDSP